MISQYNSADDGASEDSAIALLVGCGLNPYSLSCIKEIDFYLNGLDLFAAQVARNLILAGHDVHVVTGAPDFVFTSEIQSPRLFLRKVC